MDLNLSPEMLFLIFLVALFAKIIGTLIGGGGFVTQPFLILLGIPPQIALANDISASAGMNITSMHVFKKHKILFFKKLLWWLPGMILGPLIGVELLKTLPTDLIKWVVSIYCLCACTFLLSQKNKPDVTPIQNIYARRTTSVFASFLVGTYIGFSGAGAAFLTGTALILTHKVNSKEMTAMRHVLHFFPAFSAAVSFYFLGWLNLALGLTLFSACLMAGYIGSHMVIKFKEETVKKLFCTAGIFMSLAVIAQEILNYL
ncbi:MAG: hypothetical protein CMF61_02445 [Magnetococcales bacterium]|nr:hypothetical protein [Magnetococcales bacterium]PPR19363.1 MAG: hypothetical protein CFH43_00229 [Pseudomonadota bacterium]